MNLRSDGTGLLGQRRDLRLVTSDFAVAWRGVESPLRNYLRSFGLPDYDVDDIVQETATRAMERAVKWPDDETLRRWSFVVARRLTIDLYRTRRRLVAIDEGGGRDVSQEDDLNRVEDRHYLQTVLTAIAGLPAGERRSLVVCGQTAAERNRANVARHRARKRLRQVVGPIAVALAWLRRQSHTVAIGGTVAAAVALPLVASPFGGAPHAGNHFVAVPSSGVPVVLVATARPTVGTPTATVSSRRHVGSVRTVGGRDESPPGHSVSVRGPAGSAASAWQDREKGHEPLVCLDGTLTGHHCVDVPHGIVSHP